MNFELAVDAFGSDFRRNFVGTLQTQKKVGGKLRMQSVHARNCPVKATRPPALLINCYDLAINVRNWRFSAQLALMSGDAWWFAKAESKADLMCSEGGEGKQGGRVGEEKKGAQNIKMSRCMSFIAVLF